jgi:hypothetical protein
MGVRWRFPRAGSCRRDAARSAYFLRPPVSRVAGTITVCGSGVIGGEQHDPRGECAVEQLDAPGVATARAPPHVGQASVDERPVSALTPEVRVELVDVKDEHQPMREQDHQSA